MTEHKMLKEICDLIGYKTDNFDKYWYYIVPSIDDNFNGMVDVREIIFTTEFMDKYIDYCLCTKPLKTGEYFLENLMQSLDNPVKYLHNLIKKC